MALSTKPAPIWPHESASAPDVPNSALMLNLAELYEHHLHDVWRLLARLGVPASELEDAAHEVFLIAFKRTADYQARSSQKTWLFGIATRVASNWRRIARRRGVGEPLPLALADPRPSPEAVSESGMKIAALHRVLQLLPVALREVFVLVELEGLSGPEIAQALDCNLNTVYSRLRVARSTFEAVVANERLDE